jgi:hypothetical protein
MQTLKKLQTLASIATLVLCIACGNDEPGIVSKPIVTDKGTAQGTATTAVIGTTGGLLTSSDGRLTVTVPAGALTANTTISIQPISNEGPLGLGKGYRLSPEGITFQQPVTLTFAYTQQVLGNAEEDFLWVITQANDGTWNAALKSEINTTAKTVTITITHFSDWALGRFIDLKLDPASKTVLKGKSVGLKLSGFSRDQPQTEDDLAPLVPIDPTVDVLQPLTTIAPNEEQLVDFRITGWSLNGVSAPVSNTNGSLNASKSSATYKAPNAKPSVNPVAVSVHLEGKNARGQTTSYTVTSSISIVDSDLYLLVKIDGTTHEYYQYGFNGSIPPDPNNISIANCGTNGNNGVALAGTFVQYGSTLVTGFALEVTNPSEGTHSLKCLYQQGNDDVSFQLGVGQKYYSLGYTTRTQVNQNCNADLRCGEVSVTFITYENKTMGNVRGFFSGTLYEPAPANSCVSDIPHAFEGEFWLKRAD